MRIPENLQPLLDGDILRYELGFAGEAGWRAMEKEGPPPFEYVQELFQSRIETIKNNLNTNKEPRLYYTSGRTFRFDIAKKKPYKGTRKENKPWHYDNLTVYMRDVLGAKEVTGIEADDQLAIDHIASNGTTVLCSRDKDLKQVPGWFHSWELGRQPAWGPSLITKEGSIALSTDRKSIKGVGLAFFYAQVLVGDSTDNIPGLPNTGPVAAFEELNGLTPQQQLEAVCEAYREFYEHDDNLADWRAELLEQGRLCWLVRRLNEDGTPQMWEIGLDE